MWLFSLLHVCCLPAKDSKNRVGKPGRWVVIAKKKTIKSTLTIALFLLTLLVGRSQQVMPKLPLSWQPDSIVWQLHYPNGTRYALLEGSRDRPGEGFTYAFFIPDGFWDKAHHHTTDARVAVVRGRLYLGYGPRINKKAARSYPVGSYLLVPGGTTHYDGSDENTIIIGTGTGIWQTAYVEK